MTGAALYAGARAALRLARQCELSASEYDRAWHVHMLVEAKRHRERACYYLRSRKWLLDMEDHHGPAH